MAKSQKTSLNSTKQAKWKAEEQATFITLLSDLLKVGFSLKQAINFCEVMVKRHQRNVHQIGIALSDGKTFSVCTRPYFSNDLLTQIEIAESNGQLVMVLGEMSKLLKLKLNQLKKIKSLLTYPLILLGFLMMLLICLQIWVFPAIKGLAPDKSPQGQPRMHFLIITGVLLGFLIILILFIALKKMNLLTRLRIYTRVPILGKVVQDYYQYNLILNLAMMMKSGLGLQDILKITNQFNSDTFLYQLGSKVSQQVEKGRDISLVIQDDRLIPFELLVFVSKGETGKQLNEDLFMYSKLKYHQLVERIERAITLIQPLLFGIVGLMIVGIYLSLLLPMYSTVGGIE